MKIKLDIDCTPEELRSFFGLPDVRPMQEELLKNVQERLSANLKTLDPETMLKTWLPAGLKGFEQLQEMFMSQMAGRPAGGKWRFEAVHTPGHTSNHLCFALPDSGILFSGDHVMGWSTSVIAPPDGDMAAYMASLDKLLARQDAVYWPTHGPAITEPQRHVRAFIAHRREREAGIIDCLKAGVETTDKIVERLYAGLNPALRGAAARSVLAHLIDLIARDIVTADGPATVAAHFKLRHKPRSR